MLKDLPTVLDFNSSYNMNLGDIVTSGIHELTIRDHADSIEIWFPSIWKTSLYDDNYKDAISWHTLGSDSYMKFWNNKLEFKDFIEEEICFIGKNSYEDELIIRFKLNEETSL